MTFSLLVPDLHFTAYYGCGQDGCTLFDTQGVCMYVCLQHSTQVGSVARVFVCVLEYDAFK